jgi:hypothetical protein
VTPDQPSLFDDRHNLAELDPLLRSRLLALDEPVSRRDWRDVVRRSGPSWASRLSTLATLGVALLAIAVTVPAFGLRLSSLIPFQSSAQTGGAVHRNSFLKFKLGAPPIAPDAIPSETRIITSEALSNGSQKLYVSPSRNGGFCYRWTDSASQCDEPSAVPYSVNWGKGRVAGAVSLPNVSAVKIKFTDGTTADPAVSWVSAPINAGFFVYTIPSGKTVAQISMK